MIILKDKQEIILIHIRDGKSKREISRIIGKDKKRVSKYINEYEAFIEEGFDIGYTAVC